MAQTCANEFDFCNATGQCDAEQSRRRFFVQECDFSSLFFEIFDFTTSNPTPVLTRARTHASWQTKQRGCPRSRPITCSTRHYFHAAPTQQKTMCSNEPKTTLENPYLPDEYKEQLQKLLDEEATAQSQQSLEARCLPQASVRPEGRNDLESKQENSDCWFQEWQ